MRVIMGSLNRTVGCVAMGVGIDVPLQIILCMCRRELPRSSTLHKYTQTLRSFIGPLSVVPFFDCLLFHSTTFSHLSRSIASSNNVFPVRLNHSCFHHFSGGRPRVSQGCSGHGR